MKNMLFCIFSLLLLTHCQNAAENKMKQTSSQERVLRHVVLFKFKDSSSTANVKKIEDTFRSLPSQINEIKDFEWGTNNSPESLNEGFTHCFNVTFANEKAREIYLPHPAHKAFVEILKPHLDKVLVLDYWSEK